MQVNNHPLSVTGMGMGLVIFKFFVRFPEWLSDNWNHIRMEDNTITYKDQTSYKTYTIKCVGIVEKEDKYLIFSRTQW